MRGIAAGSWSTCALTDDHDVRCWGFNTDGVFGNGTFKSSSTPKYVVWDAPAP